MSSVELTVLSYNVRGFRDDMAALATIINEISPDVVAFQEIPRYWFSKSRSRSLLDATGLSRVVGGGGRAYGNMIAASGAVTPLTSGVVRFPKLWGEQPRAAAWAHCEFRDAQFTLIGVHLGHHYFDRARHLSVLGRSVAQVSPWIVVGDFNEKVGGPTWQWFERFMRDAAGGDKTPTFSTGNPRRRIDAVFVDPTMDVVSYEVVQHPLAKQATDHFPIVTKVSVAA